MATLGSEILDAHVAQSKPVTSRVLRAMRGNLRSLRIKQTYFANVKASGTTTSSTFATVDSFDLRIPGDVIGPSGTKLTLQDATLKAVPTIVIPRLQTARLNIGADNGTEVLNFGTGTLTTDMVITWTPTGDTDVTVNLQAHNVSPTGNTIEVTWGDGGGVLLLEPVYS